MKRPTGFLVLLLICNILSAQLSPIPLGSSTNVYTIMAPQQNQVYANDSLNTVLFIHRQNIAKFGGLSADNGKLRYDISTNGGLSFDNDIGLLNPIYTNPARFPQVTLFNPLGSKNPFDTKMVWFAPTVISVAIGFNGFANGTLSTTNTSPPASTETYQFPGRSSFVPGGLSEGKPGEFWTVNIDTNTDTLLIFKGIYDNLTQNVDWDIFQKIRPNYSTSFDMTERYIQPNIAFSPDKSTAWIAFLGDLTGGLDTAYNPILMKSSDGGTTWGMPQEVDLRNYPWIADSLKSRSSSSPGVTRPSGRPTTTFEFDLTVDANGNPHLFIVVGASETSDGNQTVVNAPSYIVYDQYTKFACDLTTSDGGLTWTPIYIAPTLAFRGTFGSNNDFIDQDNFLQISRTENGDVVFYSWADTDSTYFPSSGQINDHPDLFSTAFRISDSTRTCFRSITGGDSIWGGRVMGPTIAPIVLRRGTEYKVPTVMGRIGPNFNPLQVIDFHYFGNEVVWTDANFVDPDSLDLVFSGQGNCSACAANIQVSLNTTDSDCRGGNGSADVSLISPQNPPYSFLWTTGDSGQSISNLSGGTYTLTILDGQGCFRNVTAAINEPNSFVVTSTKTNVSCFGSTNGSATVQVTGGIPPYSYQWSTGDSSNTISGLAPGNYRVLVTDSTGCNQTEFVNIAEPTPIQGTTSRFDQICGFPVPVGTINPIINGGTPPYSYLWSTGDTTVSIINLPSGAYTLTVTDAKQCQFQISDTIIDPSDIRINSIKSNLACNGDSSGSISLSVSGSNPPFTYLWSNGETTDSIANLPAGTYTVRVTGSTNCSVSDTIMIEEPEPILLSVVDTAASCFGENDGSASISVVGSNGPFTFEWSSGDTGTYVSDLQAGEYSIVVRDSADCFNSIDFEILQPDSLQAVFEVKDLSCFEAMDGSASVTVIEGVDSLSYTWIPFGGTDTLASGLPAGTYLVHIVDGDGCVFMSDSIQINEPDSLELSFTKSDETVSGAQDGSATAIPSGGTSPYQFQWESGDTTEQIVDLAPGEYAVSIIDSNGCAASDTVRILPGLTSLDELKNAGVNSFEIYPNPSTGIFALKLSLERVGKVELEIFDLKGKSLYTKEFEVALQLEENMDLSRMAKGVYLLAAQTSKGMIYKRIVIK